MTEERINDLEAEIEQRGLESAYITALMAAVDLPPVSQLTYHDSLILLQATPEQRLAAARSVLMPL